MNRNPELKNLPFIFTSDLLEELRLRFISKDRLINELQEDFRKRGMTPPLDV